MRFEHRAVPIVLAAVLIDSIGFGIVIPVLPALVRQLAHVGADEAARWGGYLLVVFALTQFFAGPILGSLGDRFGRRPVLLASMLAFSADYALMSVAPTIGWLFLGRAVAGAAGAVYGPANAVLADVTPAEKRGGVFGLMGASFGMGFVLGPAIGGLLTEIGPRAPFLAASLIALANAAAMMFLLPETLAPENRRPFEWRSAHIVGAFRPLLAEPGAAPLLVVAFLWIVAHNVYPATWGFWAAIRFGWDSKAIGWSLAYVGVVMAVVQGGLTGVAIKRIGARRAVLVGMASGATAFLLYAFITRSWMAYALFLIGAMQGFVWPSVNGLLSGMVDPTRQGALQGGMASVASVASIIGPLVLSQTLAEGAERGFPGAAFLLAGILALAALLIFVLGTRGLPGEPSDPISPAQPAEEKA